METKICDRCKKAIIPDEGRLDNHIIKLSYIDGFSLIKMSDKERSMDLCRDCFDKFKDWLQNK